MKFLIRSANAYMKQMDIWDISLLKMCMCAIGVLIGINISERHKKVLCLSSLFLFIATYIPLMGKFFGVMKDELEFDKYSFDEDCFESMD